MYYIIYRTTNLINGKVYVGKHKTDDLDDGYLGSGKLLWAAVAKYGKENFKTEILFELSSEEEMDAKEAELVTEEFVSRDDNYNLCVGGQGGWSYVNANLSEEERTRISTDASRARLIRLSPEQRHLIAKNANDAHVKKYGSAFGGVTDGFKGKKHTPESREKIAAASRGRFQGRIVSEETKQKIRQTLKDRGIRPPKFTGKKQQNP